MCVFVGGEDQWYRTESAKGCGSKKPEGLVVIGVICGTYSSER